MLVLTTKWRRRATVLGVICVLATSSGAEAQTLSCTKFFLTGGTDLWHDDTNWNPVGVPGPTDVACILDGGDYMITVSLPVEVAGFEFTTPSGNPKLKFLNTVFTLNGPGLVAGTSKLKINYGAVLATDGGGVMEVHSRLVVGGGTVDVDVELYGHLNYENSGSVTGAVVTYPGSVIELEEGAAEGHLTISDGFDLNGTLNFGDAATQSVTVSSGPLVVTADGAISVQPDGVRSGRAVPELLSELVNHGLMNVDGVDLHIARGGSEHENAADGVIQVSDAEIKIDLNPQGDAPSNFTNYGTVTVAGGGTIRIVGSAGAVRAPSNFTNYGTATVAGGGTIRIVGSAGAEARVAVVNGGLIQLDFGSLMVVTQGDFENLPVGQFTGAGRLDLSQAMTVLFDGELRPGFSPGIFSVLGTLPEGPNARLVMEVGGETAGVNLDRLDISGALEAAGTLEVVLFESYHPDGGEAFSILTYDRLSGWFDDVMLPPLMHLLSWDVVTDEHELRLEVFCQGTQLGIELAANLDPVSVGHELRYRLTTANQSQAAATSLLMALPLPANVVFQSKGSSPECALAGSTVECSIPDLLPQAVWDVSIFVQPVAAGEIDTTATVQSWECDTLTMDNSASISIQAVIAEPCDANSDLSIDGSDLEPAVGHIFGGTAPGNPDCRIGDGITADDLAAIIEASQ